MLVISIHRQVSIVNDHDESLLHMEVGVDDMTGEPSVRVYNKELERELNEEDLYCDYLAEDVENIIEGLQVMLNELRKDKEIE